MPIPGLGPLLRWIRGWVHNLYAAGGLLLVIGLLLAVLGLFGLSLVVDEVLRGATLRADEAALRWLAGFVTPERDVRALEITSLGSGVVVFTVATLSAALLALLSRGRYAVLVIAAVAGGWILSPVLKALFDRDRPQVVEWRTPHAGQASFPSGHALMGMVLYAVLAFILHRVGGRRWVSLIAFVAAALLVALIGVTRVYLGVHYPSDVLAGYVVGFAWAAFCAAGVELTSRAR